MTGPTTENPVRDLLANMTAESLAASSLGEKTLTGLPKIMSTRALESGG
jgi:hypothetical protein